MTLTLSYNANVPFGPDDPADDQPLMLVNTQSINTWTSVDHIGYETLGSGLHKKVTMFASFAPPGFPNGGSGALYGFLVGANTMPWWETLSAGTFPLVSGVPSVLANGYTYLAGLNLLLQWGSVPAPGASGTVSFTPNFANVFSVQLTPRNDGSHSAFTYYIDGAPAVNQFQYRGTTSGSQTLYWMAIGN